MFWRKRGSEISVSFLFFLEKCANFEVANMEFCDF